MAEGQDTGGIYSRNGLHGVAFGGLIRYLCSFSEVFHPVRHPLKLTRLALRSRLRASLLGICLIVSSLAGITRQHSSALCCAFKHAILGFIRSMAQADRDENFRVVRICNGRTVSTPQWTGEDARGVNAQFTYTKEMCISPSDEGDDAAKRVQERLHSRRVEAECERGVGEQGSDRRN